MARYVLLSFDDNDDADKFVDWFNKYYPLVKGSRVVRAMFQKPTLFCECGAQGKGKAGGFVRGKKYGWWVHSTCGKPTRAWAGGHAWYATLGTNLLPKSDDAPEYRGDGVWCNKWDPISKTWVWDEELKEKQATGQQIVDVCPPEGIAP